MVIGFALSYFLFTTILYGVLFLLQKLPPTWTYSHIMAITLLITCLGWLFRWLLK